MPSGWDTVCLSAGGGVATGDPSGCATTLAFEGKLRQSVDTFAWTLSDAREAVLRGEDPGWGSSRTPPYVIANDMIDSATTWCKMYPGSCPSDALSLAQKYVQILTDLVAQFGFSMQGSYSSALDNQPTEEALFPEGVVTTPVALTPNVISYSPSAGWRPPIDSLSPTLSPTIPAYTSSSNVAATAPGSPSASGGGTTLAGTASGAGPSQGGSTTQQTSLTPGGGAGGILASLSPESQNARLLLILLIVAVAVIIFGRN